MRIINTHEAKTHLSKLLEQVARGEEIIIAKAGTPIARLVGYRTPSTERSGGQWKGLVRMSEDFDAPLPDDLNDAFGVQH